jgi:diacylglycerol kinase (ATP)
LLFEKKYEVVKFIYKYSELIKFPAIDMKGQIRRILMEKILIVANPAAAGGTALKEYDIIKKTLEEENIQARTVFSEYAGHSIELAKNAFLEAPDKIISFGGDGTHNEVMNGIVHGIKEKFNKDICNLSDEEKLKLPPLGLVSIGSGNDLRKTLNIPKDIKESLQIALKGKEKLIDAGYFEFKNFEGKDDSRYFLNVLSGGFSGTVTMKANQAKKTVFKNFIYLNALLKTLLFSGIPDGFLLNEDGRIDGKFFEFDISNGKYFGGGMMVSPNSEIDDGNLDISLFRDYTGIEVLFKIKKLYNGTIIKEKKLYYRKTKEIYIECTPKALVEVDGEVVGYTPIKAKVIKNAIKIIVP